MEGTTLVMRKENDSAAHSTDLATPRIESIEDLLRTRGFFDTFDREKREEEVLVS
jgi:hypothetical protein